MKPAFLAHRELAGDENEVERFFLNVVLLRVLYAHALAAAPQLARLGMAGVFLSLASGAWAGCWTTG